MEELYKIWQHLLVAPLQLTFSFTVELKATPLEGVETVLPFVEIDHIPSESSLEDEDEEVDYFGFDVSKIIGGKQ
jgi:hypothetical protein